MSRFLHGWELGGGLGHVGWFVPVAERMQREGHEVTLALRDLRPLAVLAPDTRLGVVQAPFCIHTYKGLADPPLNYAEILMRYGYLDADMLHAMVKAWRDLLQLTRAEVMIADHSPSALLAAATLGIPCVAYGTTFTVPPQQDPTPNMRHWLEVPQQRLVESDAQVLAAMNAVLVRFGSASLARVSELFDVRDTVMVTYRELDHYALRPEADRERIHFCGPIASTGGAAVPPNWPDAPGPRIFAYLKPEATHVVATLRALSSLALPAVVFGLGGAPPAAAQPLHPNLVFSARPIDVAAAANECAAGICHSGTVAAALLQAGKPQLLLPMQLEQYMQGARVAELGAGLVISGENPAPDIAAALSRLLAEPEFTANAGKFAAKYRDHTPDSILASVTHHLVAAASPT